MNEIIETFHIDYKMLIAQMINFAIILGVLYKFAYGPMVKHMDERSKLIEKGLDDAKKAGENLAAASKEREEKILQAKKEARQIIEDAQVQAEKSKDEIVDRARVESEKVVEQAKEQIQNEKEKMIVEVKKEIGTLVFAATAKIVEGEIDQEKNAKLIAKTIEEAGN